MKLRPLWTLAALCILMTACATIQPTATSSVLCTAFSPMTYSAKNDTAATVLEIRTFNAQWHALCK